MVILAKSIGQKATKRILIGLLFLLIAIAAFVTVTQTNSQAESSDSVSIDKPLPEVDHLPQVDNPGGIRLPIERTGSRATITIRVLDLESKEPVKGASVSDADNATDPRFINPEDKILGATSDEGLFPVAQPTRRVLVTHPDYCAEVKSLMENRPTVVLLTRGHLFNAECVDAGTGTPIPGATVVLSKQQIIDAHSIPAAAVANRKARNPIWSAKTDSNGRVTLKGIPSGSYHITCDKANLLVPLPGLGGNASDVQLSIPYQKVFTLRCLRARGVVVQPVGQKGDKLGLLWSRYRPDDFSHSRSGVAHANRMRLETDLKAKFPNACIQVTFPEPVDVEGYINLSMLVDTGARKDVKWPLKPVEELRVPDYLTVGGSGPLTKVTVRTLNRDGAMLNGIPISFLQSPGEMNFRTKSGKPCMLPPGKYVLTSMVAGPSLNLLLQSKKVEIGEAAGGELIVDLKSKDQLRMLRVVPQYETRVAVSGIGVGIRHSKLSQSITLLNYYPGYKPALDFYLPQGRVEIRIGGGEFATTTLRCILDANIQEPHVLAPVIKLR